MKLLFLGLAPRYGHRCDSPCQDPAQTNVPRELTDEIEKTSNCCEFLIFSARNAIDLALLQVYNDSGLGLSQPSITHLYT